ncbi:SWIM zinc finger family protein [Paenibacillus harenae]|uniref:SWIM zinc finger family protein n=1 Tax=Paenibacillus harenae TaxID=306543 RepID=UPI0027945508|nr:hypothetical protein [Paenibacillus harenae]MDQ0062224.1 hypothetical protein [Paenibacillus harenae]
MDDLFAMDQGQWNMLIQDVADNFDEATVKRGYAYYRQGRVLHLSMSAPQHIEGVVEGNENYEVEMNLDFFTLNHCTCPVRNNCKHQFAVLLEYARLQNRSVETLVNAQQYVTGRPAPRTATSMTVDRRPKPSAAKPVVASAAELSAKGDELPRMTIEQWHEWFALCTASLQDRTRNAQYAQDSLKSIFAHKPSLSPVLEQFLQLHARLFVLQALTMPMNGSSMQHNFYMGFFTHSAASDVEKEIMGLLDERLALRDEPEQWERATGTLAFLRRKMLTQPRNQSSASAFYFELWTNWLQPNMDGTELYAEELRQLEAASDTLGSELRAYPWTIARSWAWFGQENDRESRELLLAVNRSEWNPDDLFRFLREMIRNEQWDRLVEWMTWIGSGMTGFSGNAELLYSQIWDVAVRHRPDAEPLMWDALKRRLPASLDAYEDKLKAYGKLREWMDYQISQGREPLDYRVTEFADIEKNDPGLLLPFYHQAVERYVLLKNRADYKNAVKLLKRLAKLYKKLKREDRWELFLGSFLDRHSRLRALSEELRKGKLIP